LSIPAGLSASGLISSESQPKHWSFQSIPIASPAGKKADATPDEDFGEKTRKAAGRNPSGL
jgi:hypothetical protein